MRPTPTPFLPLLLLPLLHHPVLYWCSFGAPLLHHLVLCCCSVCRPLLAIASQVVKSITYMSWCNVGTNNILAHR